MNARVAVAARASSSQRPAEFRLSALLPALLPVTFAFLCFFPYPALDLGNTVGLQINQIAALLILPFAMFRYPRRPHLLSFGVLLGTMVVTACVAVLVSSSIDSALVWKTIGASVLALVVLIPSGWIASKTESALRRIVGAVCAALILQFLVGADQFISFQNDTFPLASLYHNPSFGNLAPYTLQIASFTQRPFGLFPEPSAMVASLGPWCILILGILLDRSLAPKDALPSVWLMVIGLACGGALMAVSRSGGAAIVAACAVVLIPLSITSGWRRRKTAGTGGRGSMLIAVATVAGTTGVTVAELTARLQVDIGFASWSDRLQSIRAGLGLIFSDPLTAVVGVGAGQSVARIKELGVNDAGAIYSLAARFIAESGLLGAMALGFVLFLAARAIHRSRASSLGWICLVAWLGSVTVTTSYLALSPIWLFLGAMLSWDVLFPRESSGRYRMEASAVTCRS